MSLALSPPFDEWDVPRHELVRRAELLIGRTLRPYAAVVPELGNLGEIDKGKLGKAVELFLGRPSSAKGEPDFPKARLDAKVVPLVKRARAGLQVKEFTYVSTPSIRTLKAETWPSSSVRRKISALLLYFEYVKGAHYLDPEDRRGGCL